jgi:hypothetical protein
MKAAAEGWRSKIDFPDDVVGNLAGLGFHNDDDHPCE